MGTRIQHVLLITVCALVCSRATGDEGACEQALTQCKAECDALGGVASSQCQESSSDVSVSCVCSSTARAIGGRRLMPTQQPTLGDIERIASMHSLFDSPDASHTDAYVLQQGEDEERSGGTPGSSAGAAPSVAVSTVDDKLEHSNRSNFMKDESDVDQGGYPVPKGPRREHGGDNGLGQGKEQSWTSILLAFAVTFKLVAGIALILLAMTWLFECVYDGISSLFNRFFRSGPREENADTTEKGTKPNKLEPLLREELQQVKSTEGA